MHSPEVELIEIFLSNIFDGNGLESSDIPPKTKFFDLDLDLSNLHCTSNSDLNEFFVSIASLNFF